MTSILYLHSAFIISCLIYKDCVVMGEISENQRPFISAVQYLKLFIFFTLLSLSYFFFPSYFVTTHFIYPVTHSLRNPGVDDVRTRLADVDEIGIKRVTLRVEHRCFSWYVVCKTSYCLGSLSF